MVLAKHALPEGSRSASDHPLRTMWRRFARRRTGVIGLTVVMIFLIAALLAPVLTTHDPGAQDLPSRRSPPTAQHRLGADELGRDIFSRLLYGSRVSFLVGGVAVGIGVAMGVGIGSVAGFFGGWIDEVLMRAMDVLLAFPYLLLAIAIVGVLGPGTANMMLAIGIWATPTYARLIRGSILAAKEQEYVEAAKALGARDAGVLWRHILPNTLSPLLVQASLDFARAILLEAGLSFLGLGVQPPTPSWGSMIASGRNVLRVAPHVTTFPGLAIMLTVLGFNLMGDALRDALDPRLKR